MSAAFHLGLALRGVAAGLLLVTLAASVRALVSAPRPSSPWNHSPRRSAASTSAPRPSTLGPRPAASTVAAATNERAVRELEEAALAYWWPPEGGDVA